jgi:hypothetical protein
MVKAVCPESPFSSGALFFDSLPSLENYHPDKDLYIGNIYISELISAISFAAAPGPCSSLPSKAVLHAMSMFANLFRKKKVNEVVSSPNPIEVR